MKEPTYADIRYGVHERNVMDVWLEEQWRKGHILMEKLNPASMHNRKHSLWCLWCHSK